MFRQNIKTPVMVLQEFAVKNSHLPPEYVLEMSKIGAHDNKFQYRVSVADVCEVGFGRSKQAAKHDAASKVLVILATNGLYNPDAHPAQRSDPDGGKNEANKASQASVNFIGTLKDLCGRLNLENPDFVAIGDIGPPHCRQFTYECRVSSSAIQATSNSKKHAKQLAAKNMLEKIKEIYPELSEECFSAVLDANQEAICNKLPCAVVRRAVMTVEDFFITLKNIMEEKNIKFEDMKEQFRERSPEGLDYFFRMLEINYKINFLKEILPISVASFDLDSPFTIMTVGSSKANSLANLIGEIYSLIDVNLGLWG